MTHAASGGMLSLAASACALRAAARQ